MKATIVHESRGRMRLRLRQKTMTLRQADLLETWLKGQSWAKEAVVHERTGCVIVIYAGERETVLAAIGGFTWAGAEKTVTLPGHSTRQLNREFQEKLVGKVLLKGAATLFLPAPLRIARVVWHMAPFLRKGLWCLGRRQVKVELLDALSIGISVCRGDFGTAGMVMFLLEIGELLEDWTRKKSVADLAESLSLHVDRVWLKTGCWSGLGASFPWTAWWRRGRSPSTKPPSPGSPSPWPSIPAARYMPAPWWRRASAFWRYARLPARAGTTRSWK